AGHRRVNLGRSKSASAMRRAPFDHDELGRERTRCDRYRRPPPRARDTNAPPVELDHRAAVGHRRDRRRNFAPIYNDTHGARAARLRAVRLVLREQFDLELARVALALEFHLIVRLDPTARSP